MSSASLFYLPLRAKEVSVGVLCVRLGGEDRLLYPTIVDCWNLSLASSQWHWRAAGPFRIKTKLILLDITRFSWRMVIPPNIPSFAGRLISIFDMSSPHAARWRIISQPWQKPMVIFMIWAKISQECYCAVDCKNLNGEGSIRLSTSLL